MRNPLRKSTNNQPNWPSCTNTLLSNPDLIGSLWGRSVLRPHILAGFFGLASFNSPNVPAYR
jgi:hypothetical protein